MFLWLLVALAVALNCLVPTAHAESLRKNRVETNGNGDATVATSYATRDLCLKGCAALCMDKSHSQLLAISSNGKFDCTCCRDGTERHCCSCGAVPQQMAGEGDCFFEGKHWKTGKLPQRTYDLLKNPPVTSRKGSDPPV